MTARRIAAAALVAVLLASSSVIRPPVARAAVVAVSAEVVEAATPTLAQANFGLLGAIAQNTGMTLGQLPTETVLYFGRQMLEAGASAAGVSYASYVSEIASGMTVSAVGIGVSLVAAQLIYEACLAYADSVGLSTGSVETYTTSSGAYLLTDSGARIPVWYTHFPEYHVGFTDAYEYAMTLHKYPLLSGTAVPSYTSSDAQDTFSITLHSSASNSITFDNVPIYGYVRNESASYHYGYMATPSGSLTSAYQMARAYLNFPYYSYFIDINGTNLGLYNNTLQVLTALPVYDSSGNFSYYGSLSRSQYIYPYGVSGYSESILGYSYQLEYDESAISLPSEDLVIQLQPEELAETFAAGVSTLGTDYAPPVVTASEASSGSVDWDPEVGGTGTVEDPDMELPEDYSTLPSGWSVPNFLAPWVSFVVPLIQIFSPFAALVAAILDNMFPSSAGWYLLSTALILAMVFGVLKRLLGG